MNCNFCGTTIKAGQGTMYVTKKGKVVYFCSMKCEKNRLVLKRKARKTGWTAAHDVEKKKALAASSKKKA